MIGKFRLSGNPSIRVLLGACFFVCALGCDSSLQGVSVSVESECVTVLESVELVFGECSEYCGSITKEGGYTIVDVEYPVLLDEVVIRFVLEGKETFLDIPLKQLAPAGLNGGYKVTFTVVCNSSPDVEVSFWRFVKVDGRFTKQEIPKRR